MSEHITHVAVFDDAARLALLSGDICAEFKQALKKHWSVGRLGTTTEGGDAHTLRVMQSVKAKWTRRTPADRLEEKLAWMIGWRCHQAADRSFKPVFRRLEPEHYERPGRAPSNASVYHDVIAFQQVYRSGAVEPFGRSSLDYRLDSHAAARALAVERTEQLLLGLWQLGLAQQQSVLENRTDPQRWLTSLISEREPFDVDPRRYARAHHQVNTEYLHRFIQAPGFYNPDDPLIQLARGAGEDLKSALATAGRQSQYAQAMALAYRYTLALNDFFTGTIDDGEFLRRSDIGLSHLSEAKR